MAIDIIRLTQEAKDGDTEAFGRLYETCARDMYRYALCVLGSEPLAQDAVQEAAMSAFQNIRSLRDPLRFKPWLFRILSNTCKRQLRAKIDARGMTTLDNMFQEAAADDPPLGRALELRQAVASLAPGERDVVVLSVIWGYDSSEVGQVLGIPSGTVRARRSRALAKLRMELDKEQ